MMGVLADTTEDSVVPVSTLLHVRHWVTIVGGTVLACLAVGLVWFAAVPELQVRYMAARIHELRLNQHLSSRPGCAEWISALLRQGALKRGMSLEEVEELLGPPDMAFRFEEGLMQVRWLPHDYFDREKYLYGFIDGQGRVNSISMAD